MALSEVEKKELQLCYHSTHLELWRKEPVGQTMGSTNFLSQFSSSSSSSFGGCGSHFDQHHRHRICGVRQQSLCVKHDRICLSLANTNDL
jgi:hypothetical protein